MLRCLCTLALAVALSACETREQLNQQFAAACRGYGFTPEHQGWPGCIERESDRRRARHAAIVNSIYVPPPAQTCMPLPLGGMRCQ